MILLNADADKMKELKDYIDVHLQEDLSLDRLAALTGQSRSKLKRHFKLAYKDSPGKYILDSRMRLAYQLLVTRNYSVNQVAEMVGYKNRTGFSHAFRKFHNLNPMDLLTKGNTELPI